jgi:ABC-type multidrug transport system fused ATPase/permease subunit
MFITNFIRALSILSRKDKKKYYGIAFVQIFLGVLDLVAVLLIGLMSTFTISGGNSKSQNTNIDKFLSVTGVQDLQFEYQVIIIALASTSLLLSRTILSVFYTRKILYFMSKIGAATSSEIIARLLQQPLLKIQQMTIQETIFAVNRGVEIISIQVLAVSVVIISDFALLVILFSGLFVVDPLTAMTSIVIFGSVAVTLFFLMHKRAKVIGNLHSELGISSNEKVSEILSSLRELIIGNRRNYYTREIANTRYKLANIAAEMNFMPYISKYVIESTLVVGAVILGGLQFLLHDAVQAISTLVIFIVAGSRIAPAILRLQQSAVSVISGLSMAEPTLDLLSRLPDSIGQEISDDSPHTSHMNFQPRVELINATFTYPEKDSPALESLTLTISAGSFVAIVGPSGAGKTTLVDVILGILEPEMGSVTISGEVPNAAILKWPGAVAYVPQDVLIINESIRKNVALGYPAEDVQDVLVSEAIEVAALGDFVESLPEGLDFFLGERGNKISGGQRQRIGIARGVFTKPKLLVLDEATSALDGGTEESVSKQILNLKGEATVIIIAHRLSTVKQADLVVYMENGAVRASGTFHQVRNLVPDFDRQATLVGL